MADSLAKYLKSKQTKNWLSSYLIDWLTNERTNEIPGKLNAVIKRPTYRLNE
jgi:hypothetical protein